MTLEAVNQQNEGKLHSARAQVRYVGLPKSPRDLYRVGVELETPANIWGIKSPPEDWHLGSVNAAASTLVVPSAQDAQPPAAHEPEIQPVATTNPHRTVSSGTMTLEGSTEAGVPIRVSVPYEQILSSLEEKLQQAAEKAVALAVAHRLDPAVATAVKSIENASEARLHGTEERVASRRGILIRLKAILTKLSERLLKNDGVSLAEAQETARHFESGVPETHPVGANMRTYSERLLAGEIEVRAGEVAHYQVNIDTAKMVNAKVVGSFRVSGGSQNDIAVALVAESEFEYWANGHQANVLFATNKVTRAKLNWPITSSGSYVLAFDNRFALLSPKRITVDIELHYYVQK